MKARLNALAAADGRITNLVGAAEAALAGGEFKEARARIDDARAMQRAERTLPALRREAEFYEVEADTHLLVGDTDLARKALEHGAALFAGVDQDVENEVRRAGALRLQRHGQRFGGEALALSKVVYRACLDHWSRDSAPARWAMINNDLGVVLRTLGDRTGGTEGARQLGEAVAAYRAALEVRTRADHPVQWAMTQNNLAVALRAQGVRTEDPEGAQLLGEAAAAYGAAQGVYTRADHPSQWAITQNNLAVVLSDRGERTHGTEGAQLLGEAIEAYRAALEVRTRADHPAQWAITQNTLAVALRAQGVRTGGTEGARLIDEAIVACRAALEVRTRADHPVQWAETLENIGLAFEALGDLGADPAARYGTALAALDAALEVFDPELMPLNHEKASANRGRIAAKLTALGG